MPKPKLEGQRPLSAGVAFHRAQHFLHGGVEADEDGPADDAVADVELDEVRDDVKERDIRAGQAVASIDAQAKTVGLTGGGDQSLNFHLALPFAVKLFGISPGVQFDELRPDAGGGFDLRGVRGDEEADVDAGVFQPAAGLRERSFLAGDIQPALSRDLLTSFRDKADNLRTKAEGEVHDLRRARHFQVETGSNAAAQLHYVAILNVPAIFAQVGGDAVGSGGFAKKSGLDGARLSFVPPPVTRFAQRGDVIDVNAQLQGHGGQRFCAGSLLVAEAAAFVPEGMRITFGGS